MTSWITERKKKDRIPLPDNVMVWVRRLQHEYYCSMMLSDEYNPVCKEVDQCRCIGWDPNTPMYRFWLCRHSRPYYKLAWREVFRNGNR